MVQGKIENLIKKAIKDAQKEKKMPEFDIPEILVEHPENEKFGDYATNAAMQIAKIVKKKPMEIANTIKLQITNYKLQTKHKTQNTNNFKLIEKIEVVEPGFINFFISKEFLQKQVGEILKKKEKFGEMKIGKNKKVNVEFISANPTGPLHIGQGRGAFFGDCLSKVLEKAGYKVLREYFINDAKNSNQIKELGKTGLGKGKTYLNKYLASIINKYKSKIKRIKNEKDAGYFLAQIIQKENKNFIVKKLKIKFDNWISEEDLYKKDKIEKIYRTLKKRNLTYKKEGAEWLKTTKFGDKQDWVLIRKTGEPTYLLSDIAYHQDKFRRKFARIINIWGADHQGHQSKIKAAAKILGYKGDLDILITQVVRLKGGLKLSKRKGQTITFEKLIDEVGLDVSRFFYLTKSLNTQMEFDLDLAKEQSEKNPVYYIQYAHARIHSILAKITNHKLQNTNKTQNTNQSTQINLSARPSTKLLVLCSGSKLNLLTHQSELSLIKQLIRFPEIIEDTAKDYQVQGVPQYATDLATEFHKFYRDCKVISDDKELSQARLYLILATQIVLKSTLNLMGISAPSKM